MLLIFVCWNVFKMLLFIWCIPYLLPVVSCNCFEVSDKRFCFGESFIICLFELSKSWLTSVHSSSQKCWVQTIYTCNISHLDIHVFTHSVFISPLCLLCKSVTFIVQYHTLDLIMRNQHKLRASARLSPFISPGPYNVPWITLQESQMTSINNWVFFFLPC